MEGVEDIPGTALVEGMSWNWETFPEYLDELDRMARVIDVSALVPHGAVRAYVMGDRGGQNAEATPDEIEAMAKVVREAVEAGAVGFSTTRTLLHRAKDGELAAGTTASADELIGIGRALGEAGAGVFELASDMFDPEAEFAWMRTIARETGRPVTFNCLQDDLRPEHWRRLVELADEATAEGARIVPQVAGRPASVLFGWDSTAHPFLFHSTWRSVADLPRAERQARLPRPRGAPGHGHRARRGVGPGRVHHVGLAQAVPAGRPARVRAGARAQRAGHRRPRGPHARGGHLRPDDGRRRPRAAVHPAARVRPRRLRRPARHARAPRHGARASATAAPTAGCCATPRCPPTCSPTGCATARGATRLGLEQAVHMQTRNTASLYGFDDRGLLAPGYLADVNVIDFDALALDAPTMVYDLPAGGRRLIQRARGYVATVKRGVVVREDDEATGERPGVLLRGAQPAPVA